MTLTKIVDGVEVAMTEEEAAAMLAEWSAPPVLSQSDYAAAIQAHVDQTAKSRGYADGVALASYKLSTVPQWAAEAQTFTVWRDSVWVAAYTTLDAVLQGSAPPTIQQLISSLPAIEWPNAPSP